MADEKFHINANDIASANLAFSLVQMLIDLLIERGTLRTNEILPVIREMASYYEAPGDPARRPIRSSSASVLRMLAAKLEESPSSEKH